MKTWIKLPSIYSW